MSMYFVQLRIARGKKQATAIETIGK